MDGFTTVRCHPPDFSKNMDSIKEPKSLSFGTTIVCSCDTSVPFVVPRHAVAVRWSLSGDINTDQLTHWWQELRICLSPKCGGLKEFHCSCFNSVQSTCYDNISIIFKVFYDFALFTNLGDGVFYVVDAYVVDKTNVRAVSIIFR